MRKYTVFLCLILILTGCLSLFDNKAVAADYATVITVTDKGYGAVAGRDSTKAIQAALDEAAQRGTDSKPSLVKIPAGIYYISSTLSIGSNTVLSLDKAAIIKKGTNTVLYMLRSRQGTKGGFNDTENITITGGVWDAEFKLYNSVSGGTVMFFAHTTNLTIKDVEIRNNYGTHLIEMGGVNKALITGCRLHGFKAKAGSTPKEAIQLDVVHNEELMPAAGIFDDSPCQNITVTGNEIYDYPRAVGSHMAVEEIYHTNITITSNKLHDLEGAAIYGYNYVNCTIKKNTMKNVGMGVVLRNYDMGGKNSYVARLKGVAPMSVKDNNYGYSIESNTITCTSIKAENVKTRDDAASSDSAKAKGIFVTGEENRPIEGVVIKKNKITADTSGIFIKCVNNAKIISNYLDRTPNAYDVTVSKYVEDCIKLNSCTGCRITQNKISTKCSAPFENGIAVRAGDNDTDKATEEELAAPVNIIDGNTIKYCSKNGIGVYGSHVEISNCKIQSTGGNGITSTQGSVVALTKLKLEAIGKIAVSLNGGTVCSASGLTVTGCGTSGFYSSASEFELADSTLNSMTEKGIMATSESSGCVTNCTVEDCRTDYGLFSTGGSVLSVEKTLVKGCGKSGVYCDNAEIKVKNCDILDCLKSGFTLNNARVNAINNMITGNAQRAFTIMGKTTGSIRNNYMKSPGVNNEISISAESSFSPYFETANRKSIISMDNIYTDECGNVYVVAE